MLRPGQGNFVLYGYNDALYQYDLEKGNGQDIYAWTNAGMDGRNIKNFFMDEHGKLWILPNLQDDIIVMMTLQKPALGNENEPAMEKELVIISGDKLWDTELTKAVGAFNIANDKYQVEIREYDNDRLAAEIMTGNGPDLIPLDVVGVSIAGNKGIVEDLAPYLEESEILSQDMLNERVLNLYTVNGKLVCIPPPAFVSQLYLERNLNWVTTPAGQWRNFWIMWMNTEDLLLWRGSCGTTPARLW